MFIIALYHYKCQYEIWFHVLSYFGIIIMSLFIYFASRYEVESGMGHYALSLFGSDGGSEKSRLLR